MIEEKVAGAIEWLGDQYLWHSAWGAMNDPFNAEGLQVQGEWLRDLGFPRATAEYVRHYENVGHEDPLPAVAAVLADEVRDMLRAAREGGAE